MPRGDNPTACEARQLQLGLATFVLFRREASPAAQSMLCAGRFSSEKDRLGPALASYRLMARWRWLVFFQDTATRDMGYDS